MIVADASALIESLLRFSSADETDRRLFASGESLHAPHFVDVEVVQVIRRYASRDDIDERRATDALEIFASLPITRHPHTPYLNRIWSLRRNLTAYDAAYVALAEALDAPLLTRDSRLAASPGHSATIELV